MMVKSNHTKTKRGERKRLIKHCDIQHFKQDSMECSFTNSLTSQNAFTELDYFPLAQDLESKAIAE